MSMYVIEGHGVPVLFSIKGLRALKAAIDLAYQCTDTEGRQFSIERALEQSPKGHLLWDPADAKTGRVSH